MREREKLCGGVLEGELGDYVLKLERGCEGGKSGGERGRCGVRREGWKCGGVRGKRGGRVSGVGIGRGLNGTGDTGG